MHGRARLRRLLALLLVATAAVTAGCARTVPVEAAPSASDPACAQVLVRLPDELGDRARRQVGSQASAAWGTDDALVVMRCGLEPLGPTPERCVRVGAVDWVTTTDEGSTLYTTYGRVPAVEIELRGDDPQGTDVVLSEVGAAVEVLPRERECT